MNKVMDTLLSHRSIRVYADKAVEGEILDQIMKAVQAAPNWVNLQHVSVVAVKDKERREKMSELCGGQKHIAQAPVFLVFCADFYRTWLACQAKGQTLDETVSQVDNLIVGANEVGIALGTAVATAESFGLGTVPIGDIRLHGLEVIQELNLPKYVLPLLGLCIGYPAENPGIKPRLPREAVYFEEQYNQDLGPLLAQYDGIYSHYLKERPWNSRVGNWTQLAADFYQLPYNHYPEVPEMLHRQGFFSGNQVQVPTNNEKERRRD
ncbi:NADPH-dependent oxidoreductase [Ruminococcus sp. OA3]|uniref:NADPH-dependent oxidoreductase n=1 Tax=Ruminococcus sp. OA3 TaxID=2914164 RepID=UPI001F06CC7F|nr:NADPH-dependent oxidoreductase [Ruminococcus sp. OA3]MCH1983871.1 NADPH-dependent oxidoreductase [Ruminococcus sp. OA3]